MNRITVSPKTHSKAVSLMKSAYPTYRGRLYSVEFRKTYRVWDFWDGGSRTYTTFVDLRTGQLASSSILPESLKQKQGNPFGLPISDDFPLPAYVGVIEHRIFCGKDRGLNLVLPDPVEIEGARALTDAVLALSA